MSDARHAGGATSATRLVGTARRPVPAAARRSSVRASAPRPRGAPREEALLDAAALGRRSAARGAPARHAAPAGGARLTTRRPAPPRRAVQLLELVLTQPPAGRAAAHRPARPLAAGGRAAGCRVPHALLPTLLDLATAHARAAPPGRRGARRARAVARRPSATSGRGSPTRLRAPRPRLRVPTERRPRPTTGRGCPSAERLAVAGESARRRPGRRRATSSPPRGRPTRARDRARPPRGAAHRARTRRRAAARAGPRRPGGTVREMAAELLDALPGSARAGRMAERLRPLVQRTGLLGRGVEVSLPDEPDAGGVRDGLGKPPPRRSARGLVARAALRRRAARRLARADGRRPGHDGAAGSPTQDALAGIRRAVRPGGTASGPRRCCERAWDPRLVPALPRQPRETRRAGPRRRDDATACTSRPRSCAAVDAAVVGRVQRRARRAAARAKVGSATSPRRCRSSLAGLHPAALDALEAWLASHRRRPDPARPTCATCSSSTPSSDRSPRPSDERIPHSPPPSCGPTPRTRTPPSSPRSRPPTTGRAHHAGGSRRGRSRPTCSAARSTTAPRSRRSTSARAG